MSAARGGQHALERIAGHRRALQQDERRGRQRRQLAGQRGAHGSRHRRFDGAARPAGRSSASIAPRASCSRKNGLPPLSRYSWSRIGRRHGGAEQVAGGGRAQRRELQARARPLAHRRRQRDVELCVELGGTEAQRDEHRAARGMGEQMPEQLDRTGIGPLDVVEDEDERRVGGERGEQVTDRPVRAVALLLHPGRAVRRSAPRRQAGRPRARRPTRRPVPRGGPPARPAASRRAHRRTRRTAARPRTPPRGPPARARRRRVPARSARAAGGSCRCPARRRSAGPSPRARLRARRRPPRSRPARPRARPAAAPAPSSTPVSP